MNITLNKPMYVFSSWILKKICEGKCILTNYAITILNYMIYNDYS